MNRIERVINELRKNGLTQMIVSETIAIKYLTGVTVYPGERLFALLLKSDGNHVFFCNRLFFMPEVPYEIVWYNDGEDVISEIVNHLNTEKPVGIDKEWPAKFLIPLIESNSNVKVQLAGDCVDNVRAIKDKEEIEKMRIASQINDAVILNAMNYIKTGMTEKEVAAFVDAEYLRLGADGNSFGTDVSFGDDAADPHHMTRDRVLKENELVLIDMGCIKDGYCSDMTRTFFNGSVSDEERHVYNIVRKANEYAESIIRPGMKLSDIDKAARKIISDAGYGEYFTHRLGHFIGQTVHEKGDVSSFNDNLAEEGMIFSIEPGIYLPGKFGVRIEDLVLVTSDGCEVLNKVSKDIRII